MPESLSTVIRFVAETPGGGGGGSEDITTQVVNAQTGDAMLYIFLLLGIIGLVACFAKVLVDRKSYAIGSNAKGGSSTGVGNADKLFIIFGIAFAIVAVIASALLVHNNAIKAQADVEASLTPTVNAVVSESGEVTIENAVFDTSAEICLDSIWTKACKGIEAGDLKDVRWIISVNGEQLYEGQLGMGQSLTGVKFSFGAYPVSFKVNGMSPELAKSLIDKDVATVGFDVSEPAPPQFIKITTDSDSNELPVKFSDYSVNPPVVVEETASQSNVVTDPFYADDETFIGYFSITEFTPFGYYYGLSGATSHFGEFNEQTWIDHWLVVDNDGAETTFTPGVDNTLAIAAGKSYTVTAYYKEIPESVTLTGHVSATDSPSLTYQQVQFIPDDITIEPKTSVSGVDGNYTFEGLDVGKGGTLHVPYASGYVDAGVHIADNEMTTATVTKDVVLEKGITVWLYTQKTDEETWIYNSQVTCVCDGETYTKDLPYGNATIVLPYNKLCTFTATAEGYQPTTKTQSWTNPGQTTDWLYFYMPEQTLQAEQINNSSDDNLAVDAQDEFADENSDELLMLPIFGDIYKFIGEVFAVVEE